MKRLYAAGCLMIFLIASYFTSSKIIDNQYNLLNKNLNEYKNSFYSQSKEITNEQFLSIYKKSRLKLSPFVNKAVLDEIELSIIKLDKSNDTSEFSAECAVIEYNLKKIKNYKSFDFNNIV